MKPSSSLLDETVREAWGLQCPKCRSDEHIEIQLKCWAVLTADGTDPDAASSSEHYHYWDKQSPCRCDVCNHHATVEDFSTDEEHG